MGEINIQHVMMLGGSELSQFILSLFCVCVCVHAHSIRRAQNCICLYVLSPNSFANQATCSSFKPLHSDMLAGDIA